MTLEMIWAFSNLIFQSTELFGVCLYAVHVYLVESLWKMKIALSLYTTREDEDTLQNSVK